MLEQALLAMLSNNPSPALVERVQRIAPLVVLVATEEGVSPLLLSAVIAKESSFRPRARGKAGEVGLSQLKPDGLAMYYCKGLRAHRLLDNIRCGARLLALAKERCGGCPRRWLSAYNGRKCGESIYSRRVMRLYDRGLSSLLGGLANPGVDAPPNLYRFTSR